MCWPIMRLVLAGHDYAAIKRTWTIEMVLTTNRAMDIQDRVDQMAMERARQNQK